MIDLAKYNNEKEFQTALKEMFVSLDSRVLEKYDDLDIGL